MKQLTFLSAVLSLISLTCCTPQKSETEIPELTAISETTIEASADGGAFKIDYSITNPTLDGKLTAECSSDWITDLKSSEQFATFSISENTGAEPREAHIDIVYDYVSGKESIAFVVKQAGAELPPEPPAFSATLEVMEVSWNLAEINITPSDESVYLVDFLKKADFDRLSEEEIFSYTINRYSNYVFTQAELIEKFGRSGESTWKIDELESLTDYVCYVFKTELDPVYGTLVLESEIFSAGFTTTEQEILEFTIDLTLEPKSTSLTLTAEPSDKEQYYFLDVASTMDLMIYSSSTTEEKLASFVNDNVKSWLDFGMAADISEIPNVFKGDQTQEYSDLFAGEEHFALAVAIDENGNICSDITYESFTPKEITSNATVTYTAKCFDGTQIAEKYPDQYADAMEKIVVVFDKEFSEDAAGYMWSVHDGDYSYMTPEQIKNDVTMWGREGDMSEDRHIYIYKSYDLAFSLLLVAYDENRYYGPATITVYSFSKEDASPIEEFIP